MFQNHDKAKQKDNYQNTALFSLPASLFHVEVAISGFLGFVFLHTRCWTGLVSTGQITTAALALQQSPLWHSIIKAQLFTTSSPRAGYLPIYYTVNLCRCTRIIGLISRAVAWFFGYTHQKTLSPIIYGFTYGGLSQEPRSLLLLWGLGRSRSSGSSNFNLRWTQTLPLIRNTFRIWFAGRYRINLFITRTKGHSFTSTFAVNENDVTFFSSSAWFICFTTRK